MVLNSIKEKRLKDKLVRIVLAIYASRPWVRIFAQKKQQPTNRLQAPSRIVENQEARNCHLFLTNALLKPEEA